MNILLSIKPKYASAIESGSKKYEFRKVIFKDSVEQVWLYASSPQKKIIGKFLVKNVIKGNPSFLWSQLNKQSGIKKDEFFSYFKNSEVGYAIEVGSYQSFSIPINPRDIFPCFFPPQSYYYIANDIVNQMETLVKKAG